MSTPRPWTCTCAGRDKKVWHADPTCEVHGEGVAAPLEPTPQIDDAFVEQIEDALGMGHGAWDMVDPVEICKAVAAAVSKNLQEELANLTMQLNNYRSACGKNPAELLKFLHWSAHRIADLEKEIAALRLELSDRDRQIKGLTEDALRLIDQAGKSPR